MENNEMIYLDHAAATPMSERVLFVMQPYFIEKFYNPSSPYLPAVQVRRDYDEAKHKIAKILGAKPGEIIMTAGATESINLAFSAISGHVVAPITEHASVIANVKNHDHTIIDVDGRGLVDVQSIKSAIKPNTEMVSVALANNEIGTIQSIRDIANMIKNVRDERLMDDNKTPIYLHCDASQGAGLVDVNVARMGVDMLTLNAGKVYGPKQVGLLWAASHVRLSPQIVGGGQERGLRSGTENVAGTIGFAEALKLADERRGYELKRLEKLRDNMEKTLVNVFPDAVLSGYEKRRLANFLHISFPGLDGERLVFLLENRGVMVATGSACAANKGLRSHVLTAIGLPDEVADGSIRITLGKLSTEENTKRAAEIIIEEIKKEYKRVGRG